MKKLYLLGLTFLLALAAAGCQLYFGEERNGDEDGFCASDGYYVRGEWVSAQCPGGGNACKSDKDCAAACRCDLDKGICEETGFCAKATDCAEGYTCDDRSTCIPDGATCGAADQPVTCQIVAPKCAQGSVPVIRDGCYYDRDEDGVFDCKKIADCATPPPCDALQFAVDCAAGNACDAIFVGRDCQNQNGDDCVGGQPGCVCAVYEFDKCEAE